MKLTTAMAAGPSPALPAHADVLAGVVVRPPRVAWDGERYTGARLQAAEAEAAAGLPGVVRVVVERDFIGIVAQTADFARNAKARLRVAWDEVASRRPVPPQPAADADGAQLEHTYRWPAAAGRSGAAGWAVAWHHGDAVTVWAACEAPEVLRQELAALLGLHEARVELRHNGLPASAHAFDAAADAVLLSRAVGKPVRVEALSDAAAGPGLLTMHVRAAVGRDGSIRRFEIDSNAPPSARPSLARLLARGEAAQPQPGAAGVSPYAFPQQRVTRPAAMALGPRSQHPDGTVAAHVFATESFIDETARAAVADPVDFRLRQLDDARGAALVRSVREQASGGQRAVARADGLRRGTGFAYASALEEATQPPTRTWTAWAVDVAVDSSGSVGIERVVVGHDAEQLRPMASEAVWIEGQVQDAAQRLLEAPSFDDWGVPGAANPAAQAKPPSVDVVRPANALAPAGGLAWSATATLPAAAALANAIFDATGVRFREPPFNGPQVQARLGEQPAAPGSKRSLAWLGGLGALAAGMLATVLPWRSAIAPSSPPDRSLYSAAAIERGRLVAAAGDCVVCHTAPGGHPNAGGLPLPTPFGTIYSTNLTPDVQTGIGSWSYAAFERAMREGIHRDGRRLYPAFPYTAFAKISDADLQALYAYLMTQPAVAAKPPETRLAFPYNVRGLLGGWNALFHDPSPYQADPGRSAEWNRGAYLVQGLGHCGACHTPRNAMGAEKGGAFLAGGLAEGWEAPALTGLSKAPLPWTHSDLYEYLRTGVSARHGVAAGPMAPVLHEMRQLPDSDIRAIATYLMSLNAPPPDEAAIGAQLQALEARAAPDDRLDGPGARIFEGACAACHQTPGGPTLFGSKVSLALNTNLHSDRPDNLVQVILRGIPEPAHENLGYMQGFADSLDDAQIEELAHYLRRRFAPDKPAWKDVGKTIRQIRSEHAASGH